MTTRIAVAGPRRPKAPPLPPPGTEGRGTVPPGAEPPLGAGTGDGSTGSPAPVPGGPSGVVLPVSPPLPPLDEGAGAREPGLDFISEIMVYGGAMSLKKVLTPHAGGTLLMAPPGTGKSALSKASAGYVRDADDIVFDKLDIPGRYSAKKGEALEGWQTDDELRELVTNAAYLALVHELRVMPSHPIASGWLPNFNLWRRLHPVTTIVCIPSFEWVKRHTNSEQRVKKGHFVMPDETIRALLGQYADLGRMVEEERAGYILTARACEALFDTAIRLINEEKE